VLQKNREREREREREILFCYLKEQNKFVVKKKKKIFRKMFIFKKNKNILYIILDDNYFLTILV